MAILYDETCQSAVNPICRFINSMMYVKCQLDLFLWLETITKSIMFPLLILAIPRGALALAS